MTQFGNKHTIDGLPFSPGGESIKTLYVDDDPAFADLVQTFLETEREHVAVRTETSVEAGMEALRNTRVDCIVSDYEMPGADGLDFLERVRADHSDLPFILFTGKGDESIASDAITAGVTEYLQKGTGTDQYTVLANRVENLVGKYRAEQNVIRGLQALEASQEGIGILNEDGEYEYLNRAYAQMYDEERDELLDSHWERLYPESEVERFRKEILPTLEAEGRWTGESVGLTADDDRIAETLSLALLDDGGHVCVVRDITEEKRRERDLRREERFLETALNSLDDLFYVFDAELNYVRWNDRFESVTGYTADEIADLTPMDLFEGETADEIESLIDTILANGERVVVEAPLQPKHGTELPYEFTGVPVADDGAIIGVVGIGRRRSE